MELKYRSNIIDLLNHFNLRGSVAELGCAEGYFSSDLLRMGVDKLIMVDNWGTIDGVTGDGNFPQEWHDRNYEAAMQRVDKYKDVVSVLRGFTVEMAKYVPDEMLAMVYLDACHTYEAVKADLHAWFPKVKPGGIIAGHDFINPAYGVKEAVEEFCKGKFEVHVITEDKDADAGFWFRKI